MKNKKIQRKRMMLYFINAADELIHQEGFEELTLRKVADRAGYNSATLYNYFENLDHLIFYASMRNIKDYTLALSSYIVDSKNAMDQFLKVWECFCDYSFDMPEIYNAIFFPNLDKDIGHYVEEYYRFFPEELISTESSVSTMLSKKNIHDRAMIILMDCVKEGFIRPEDAGKLNDMTLLIYEGILNKVLKNKVSYDNARNSTMDYFKYIINGFLIKEYDFYY